MWQCEPMEQIDLMKIPVAEFSSLGIAAKIASIVDWRFSSFDRIKLILPSNQIDSSRVSLCDYSKSADSVGARADVHVRCNEKRCPNGAQREHTEQIGD